MAYHRKSYQKTIIAAAGAALVAAALGVLLLALPGAARLLAVPPFGLALAAGLVVAGGLVALRRDTLEVQGTPYYSMRPREHHAGPLLKAVRNLVRVFSGSPSRLRLLPGEWVQVRPYAEIAATLDASGDLEGLPFMPEMLRHCGQRARVMRRIEKVHDYVHHTGLRRMRDAVLLEGLRCSGASHGGCQAACQFLWKEAWLVPVSGPQQAAAEAAPAQDPSLDANTSLKAEGGELRYRCQMTQLPQASSPMGWGDPRHYWRDLWTGNVRIPLWLTSVALALFNAVQKRRGGSTAPFRTPNDRKTSPALLLGLQQGERVRVKSRPEIETTLNSGSRNRGLWFDVEMHRFCGGEFTVGARVSTMVEEASGKLLTLGNPCILLEDVSASGEYLGLCPQNELIYWREIWLERIAPKSNSA